MPEQQLYFLIAYGAVWVFQIFYWAFFMFRIKPINEETTSYIPVSVIICARNEAENLAELIPILFKQKYVEYQVVVVDDASFDDTPMVLARLKEQYPNLYYTTIPTDQKFRHGKKLAVTVGIKAAKYEHLLFIDADCRPVSDRWIHEMVSSFTNGKQIVLGYGKYKRYSGFLNYFIRYETFWNAVQYMGYAAAWKPFMAVGRNLAYTKTLFGSSSQFRNNYHILSGDDDLFVAEMGTKRNTAGCTTPESQTESEPKRTWQDWAEQKSRHFTTAPLYPRGIRTMLGAETITRQLLLWGGVALLVFADFYTRIGVGAALLVREIVMYCSLGLAQKRMREKGLAQSTLIMDIIVPYVQAFVWLWGKLSKHRNTWK